jgi:hypothetical protein
VGSFISASSVLCAHGLSRTDGGDSGDDFTELELVKNCGLSGSIETDHENAHLLLSPELIEKLRECKTHDCGGCVVLG